MQKLPPTIFLVVLWNSLAPATLTAQTPVEARFEQLRTERFQAVVAMAAEASPPPTLPAPPLPETLASSFDPPWRARLSQSEWQLLRESFRAEDVPLELLAVGWVESRFNPLALSPKGARGVWQLMPATARRYGLRVSVDRDDRTNLRLSTRAAARHLADLYDRFGDWPLALAAYNAGPERIEGAIARAGTQDFWALRPWLPAETQGYVPAVLRALRMLPNPASRGSAQPQSGSLVVFALPSTTDDARERK